MFIFTDDHAVQAIGAYGSKINATPNIDRIAESGCVFTRSFCGNSICGPSRATVLTGKHSHKNGFLSNSSGPFDGSQTTFPKLLRAAGYQTALVGKWHLKSQPTGFDYWEILQGQGDYYNPVFLSEGAEAGESDSTQAMGYCTDLITDKAVAWLNQRDADRPFLLMCQHKAPHRTWAPPLRYLDRYEEQDIPEPATLFDDYQGRSRSLAENKMSIDKDFSYPYDLKIREPVPFANAYEQRFRDNEYARMTPEQRAAWEAAFGPRNEAFLASPPQGRALVRWKYQRYIKNYLRCIDAVDDGVGRLLDYLEEQGLSENTIVVYGSDQGFYLGEHGWFDKRWMFEESLKMPLLMRWPGVIPEGAEQDALVQNIDYGPTFLDAAGLPPDPAMQGESMRRLFTEEAPRWRDAVYYHYYEGGGEHNVPRHEGVRTARYKLIYFYDRGEYNLFDLKSDPNELRSLHDEPGSEAVLAEMKSQLQRLRRQYEVTAGSPERRNAE
ncbi:Arylsulfatase [Pirellulimonas nuda]|uniref:Arylsulfatase n=1 Tax=Pirellulimonas nuda TaxID=2528009 RepID=A0A518DBN9_9BACT|nr:sulfatase [Pirellulimonas nuda]QDU88889.1 Arylsulfatase [Pirellulimonas nuda]